MNSTLAPGLTIVHGNRVEDLCELLLAWMRRYPLAPLESECLLVPGNGIAQWFKMVLAGDPRDGGLGIAAALDAQLPARFIWNAYRAVLGEEAIPATSPFDRELLSWRLMRLLPTLPQDDAVFAPLMRFLSGDADLRKRYQLARRLADLFDQYQVYRADWLARWSAGEDVIVSAQGAVRPVPEAQGWQPQLWRLLREDVGADAAEGGRADVHGRFLAAAQGWPSDALPPALPRRLLVFGLSALPRQALEVLAAVARWTHVLMCVHNPCRHHWADIVPDAQLLRATQRRQARKPGMPDRLAPEHLHLHAHPLLAAWGRQGRDFIGLLDEHEGMAPKPGFARPPEGVQSFLGRPGERLAHNERGRLEARGQRVDLFGSDDAAPTLLRQLQQDILELRPLAETRTCWPPVDARADTSVRFHVAHGPQREVEVLHDQLLAAFDADPTLHPREVLVMVPDIALYAPHVQAVFGLPDASDARRIPFSVADQGAHRRDPLLGALELLLALPRARFTAGEVLDLLDVPALRRRFGIDEAQVPLLRQWATAAQVRWGLHAEQRSALDLPDASEQNTWAFGLRRMWLGYAVGDGAAWHGIEPLDEIGGLDAAWLGPFTRLIDALDETWRALSAPAAPSTWCARLRRLLVAFFDAHGDEGFVLLRLEEALQVWQDHCTQVDLTDTLPLSVVRDHWLAAVDQDAGLSQPFLRGAVTFATLLPMRAIPFRRVCLLGMNDGDYPRAQAGADFDLMAHDYQPGDRSRREDDRYLFLEALLSAREHLHVSWVGRDIHDNTERAPSVLVAQLRDHIAQGWRLASDPGAGDAAQSGAALLHAISVEHRLQPFHPDYFMHAEGPLFSYALEWRTGLAAAHEPSAPPSQPLAPLDRDTPLTFTELASFLRRPVRAFFQMRLKVHFDDTESAGAQHEPFAADGLENWQLQDELIQAQRRALEHGEDRVAAMDRQLARMHGRGALPIGHFADLLRERLAEPMASLFERHGELLQAWPSEQPDEEVEWIDAPGLGLPRVSDWLGGMRHDAEGRRGRLLLDSGTLGQGSSLRRERLLAWWPGHLAGHLGGEGLTTLIVAKDHSVVLPPLDPDVARAAWRELLAAWGEGMRRPLPFAALSAFAWLRKAQAGGGSDDPAARDAARRAYEGGMSAYETGECEQDAYLARAWPDFEALWAQGEFRHWAERLLRPFDALLGASAARASAKARQ